MKVAVANDNGLTASGLVFLPPLTLFILFFFFSKGERLSHAVGCAFAVCLERKQKRDKECSVTMNFDSSNSTFTRSGSFRAAPMTERIQDPQEYKPAGRHISSILMVTVLLSRISSPPLEPPAPAKAVVNPFAIERPHAAPHLLERQGSFRGLSQLNQSSPFKRQMSLRIGDLPSTVERQQNSLSNEAPSYKSNLIVTPGKTFFYSPYPSFSGPMPSFCVVFLLCILLMFF